MRGKLVDGILGGLSGARGPLLVEPTESPTQWAGVDVPVEIRPASPGNPVHVEAAAGACYAPRRPVSFPPLYVSPSRVAGEGRVGKVERIGDRIALKGPVDMSRVGEAVHGFFAADDHVLVEGLRLELADGMLHRWGVQGCIEPTSLLSAAERLRAWVASRWPGAVLRREWPIRHELVDGTIVRGAADLVVEWDAGAAVIDHKSFPGDDREALGRVPDFAGQLRAYANAVRVARRLTAVPAFVHLPMLGLAVELVFDELVQ